MKTIKLRFIAITLAALFGLAFGFIYSDDAIKVSAAAQPAANSIIGSVWSYTCPNYYNGYLEVPYAGRNDSNIAQIILNGSNLSSVTGVSVSASGYTVSISSKSASRLVLDVRAGQPAENPRPVANPIWTLTFPGGSVNKQLGKGLIPALYNDSLDWGQCTWWAGGIARIQSNRPVVKSYSTGVAISPNPSSSGFPKVGSVLMTYQKHMSYLTTITETSRVNNRDGSTRITYELRGTQYNGRCDAQRSDFPATTMTILRSNTGTYSWVSKPKVIYEIDRVAQ